MKFLGLKSVATNEQYCYDCFCHDGGETVNSDNCPEHQILWISDGMCDDATNIEGKF